MWLLDANLPVAPVPALAELGRTAHTARSRGWDALSNGALVAAATDAGFSALLTRDRLFPESAAQALKRYPVIGIAVIVLPQLRSQQFIDAFRTSWIKQPIEIVPAEVIEWPSSS
jgi:uncharacterized protein DUF5615